MEGHTVVTQTAEAEDKDYTLLLPGYLIPLTNPLEEMFVKV